MLKGIKEVYVLMVIVIGLLFLSLYSSYGLFVSTSNDLSKISLKTELTYKFDLNSNQILTLDPGAIIYFNMVINNTSGTNVYYEIYSDNTNNNVIVAEVVENTTTTTSAPNTSGNIVNSANKTVPIIIVNNSENIVSVKIGVVSALSDPILYGTSTFPSGVSKVTGVYAKADVPDEYCSGGNRCEFDMDLCYISGGSIENGNYYREYTCMVEVDPSPTIPSMMTYSTPSATAVTYTVPVTGYYMLEIAGASGGKGGTSVRNSYATAVAPGGNGGRGGYIKGKVFLNAGEVLNIYVGGIGGNAGSTYGTAGTAGINNGTVGTAGKTGGTGYYTGGGGGGGGRSYVTFTRGTLNNLIIAYGGGGGGGGAIYSTSKVAGSAGGAGGGGTAGGAGGEANNCNEYMASESVFTSCRGKNGGDGTGTINDTYVELISMYSSNVGAGYVKITFDSFLE